MRIPSALIAAMLLCGAPAGPTSLPIATVAIDLSSYRYTPSTLHLTADRPVELRFTNSAGSGHDFTSPRFFAAAKIVRGPVDRGPVDRGPVDRGKVSLRPGASATVVLIPAKGIYEVRCTHMFHALLGMTGRIVVD